MIGYHVTTPKKINRYKQTGCILEPVRFWSNLDSAISWSKRTGRYIILQIETSRQYPLPDHKPRGHAYWTDQNISSWKELDYARL